MPVLTLAFLFRDNKILLAMKKRRFGVGKWNGYGGKILEGETKEEALLREIKEESGLDIKQENLKYAGEMDFYFTDKNEWDQSVVVYRIDEFEGEPEESEEMKPEWFELDQVPYGEMWAGDDKWIPYVIESKIFKGKITFSNEGEKVVECIVE